MTRGRKRTETKPKGEMPTHLLKMKRTLPGGGWTTVGACWETAKGNLSCRLDPGTVLDWHDFVGVGDAKPEFSLVVVPSDGQD